LALLGNQPPLPCVMGGTSPVGYSSQQAKLTTHYICLPRSPFLTWIHSIHRHLPFTVQTHTARIIAISLWSSSLWLCWCLHVNCDRITLLLCLSCVASLSVKDNSEIFTTIKA
jgi:hypothetical protein